MISQSDIIRSLVNKNCTDESIMSIALSPDCTLPKLLQKFTETERFDLALDVYMKLGMDVVPLWKTWAMRCLRNRNFQSARNKFRHCFQRLRLSAGRFGTATSVLLKYILRELTRMEETKLSLNDEIELIKSGKSSNTIKSLRNNGTAKIIELKPTIFNECMHYLKEYGTSELLIKFYVDNELWNQAIVTLYESKDARYKQDKNFISDVIVPAETNGHLDIVITELLKLDPIISDTTARYFQAIYCHYVKRYNTLYYVQHEIGDFVSAAENQIRMFLREPTLDYKELNQRLPCLQSARDDYNQHLDRLNCDTQEVIPNKDTRRKNFITQLSLEETEFRLKTIDTQIEITHNFALNEVPGCINGVEVVLETTITNLREGMPAYTGTNEITGTPVIEDDDSPVTLFDTCPRRKTFLAAIVLIYFDLDCANYISDGGFVLANRIINENDQLDKLSVFKTAMHIIIEDESSHIIENATLLLQRLRDDYIACTYRVRSRSSLASNHNTARRSSNISTTNRTINQVISKQHETTTMTIANESGHNRKVTKSTIPKKKAVYNFEPADKSIRAGSDEAARLLCDEVIRDSIKSCREEDYKMELAKLLSPEAKLELYIELGKLSIAQRLACDMNRPDYVKKVMKEAEKLNQDHVKDVCQHWLAKH